MLTTKVSPAPTSMRCCVRLRPLTLQQSLVPRVVEAANGPLLTEMSAYVHVACRSPSHSLFLAACARPTLSIQLQYFQSVTVSMQRREVDSENERGREKRKRALDVQLDLASG